MGYQGRTPIRCFNPWRAAAATQARSTASPEPIPTRAWPTSWTETKQEQARSRSLLALTVLLQAIGQGEFLAHASQQLACARVTSGSRPQGLVQPAQSLRGVARALVREGHGIQNVWVACLARKALRGTQHGLRIHFGLMDEPLGGRGPRTE